MYISRDGDEAARLAAAIGGRRESNNQDSIAWKGDALKRAFDAGAVERVAIGVTGRSSDPLQKTNTSIGIAVGVVLGVFLIGLFLFIYRYPHTLRCGYRKKKHRGSSRKGSKTSSSDGEGAGEGAPAPADAAPAEPAADPPAEA